MTQDIGRRITSCFVAVERGTSEVAAFYTLSAASIPLTDLPLEQTKRLPRYPVIPAIRIGRLAVPRAPASQPRTLFLPLSTAQKALLDVVR